MLLLLVPFATGLLLLGALAGRPLVVGPYVLATGCYAAPPQAGWRVQWAVIPKAITVMHLRGGTYQVQGPGGALVLECQGRTYALGGFPGRRLR